MVLTTRAHMAFARAFSLATTRRLCRLVQPRVSSMHDRTQWRSMTVNWDKVVAKKPAEPNIPAPAPTPAPPAPAQLPGQPVVVNPYEVDPAEARLRLERILSEPYLAIQRKLDMANLLIGYDQANYYTLYNRLGQVVGYMREESSLGKAVIRNLARNHHSFKATIFDPTGAIVCRISRPFYFISSHMTVQGVGEHSMGEIFRSWHLWRRKYEMYDANKHQFATINAPLLSWEFTMEDQEGKVLAAVDKNFTGLGTIIQTLFTDAHTYIVHLDPGSHLYDFSARLAYETPADKAIREGKASPETVMRLPPGWEEKKDDVGRTYYLNTIENKTQWEAPQGIVASAEPGSALAPRATIGRKLSIEEKAVVLGCAVSIDFDFFSRHTGPSYIMPVPIPMGGGGTGVATGGAAGAGGAAADAGLGGIGAATAASQGLGESSKASGLAGGGDGEWAGSSMPGGEQVWEEGKEVWKGGEGAGEALGGAAEAGGSAWEMIKTGFKMLTGWDD